MLVQPVGLKPASVVHLDGYSVTLSQAPLKTRVVFGSGEIFQTLLSQDHWVLGLVLVCLEPSGCCLECLMTSCPVSGPKSLENEAGLKFSP